MALSITSKKLKILAFQCPYCGSEISLTGPKPLLVILDVGIPILFLVLGWMLGKIA